ncbi:MAG: 16S rRNA (guanine(527)-N(7))-methyltransferase RsmG [Clostridia bacterium]|nr:16S rRNA (guanine(527)-N(7))-methyltransferase RsmG [Clostridia bacterium]
MDTASYAEIIKNKCSEKFGQFERLLLEYNKKCNLTSITDEKEVFIKHFLDSVLGESFFPQKAKVVEIGSGGGFPSIPLKIIRDDLSFTLIESTGKKCNFLNDAVEKIGLNCVQVLNIRAEDGAKDKNLREKFDVACARAVARLNVLCEYCLPFVRVGGSFIAYKGEACDEIKEAENAVKVLGGKIEEVLSFDLPGNGGKRNIIKITKIKPTPPEYPRGQGRERKNPL